MAGGVDFTFPPNVTLNANQSLLVVGFDPTANSAELAWFRNEYGLSASVQVFGPYSSALANEGEEIQLLKPDPPQTPPHPDAGFVPYVLVESVHYLPTAPWPTTGIGSGASLQRIVPANFGNEPLNWLAAPPSAGALTPEDADGDGLPNDWEVAYHLNPSDPNGDNGANGDPDKDGETNGQEFIAGTDPRNAASALRFDSANRTGAVISLRFLAMSGKNYTVQFRTNLASGSWEKLTDVPVQVTNKQITITDTNNSAGLERYYRLVIPAQ